jgi:hypothetical protein
MHDVNPSKIRSDTTNARITWSWGFASRKTARVTIKELIWIYMRLLVWLDKVPCTSARTEYVCGFNKQLINNKTSYSKQQNLKSSTVWNSRGYTVGGPRFGVWTAAGTAKIPCRPQVAHTGAESFCSTALLIRVTSWPENIGS